MPHDRARHVVIIGGSVAGMSSAITVSQQGLRVTPV
jgi:2-polyprenyl-6-methoxyphenol hydroxylase-like FAD-dependent oxidoreductase